MRLQHLYRLRDWPLRVKLVVFLVLAEMVPVGVVSWIDIRDTQTQLHATTAAVLAARGDQLASGLDVFNRGYLRSVERLAQLPSVMETRGGPLESDAQHRRAQADLMAWPANDPHAYAAGILDLSGKVRNATQAALVGLDLSGYRAVAEALRGTTAISDMRFVSSTAAGVPVITYFAAVRDDARKIVGLAAIWVHASSLWDTMKSSNELAGPGSFAVLFDQYGIRIAHTYSTDIIFHPGGPLPVATRDKLVAERRFGPATRELLDDVRPFPAQFERALAVMPDPSVFRGFAPVNQKWNYGVARRFETIPWTVFYMLPEDALVAQVASTTWQKAMLAMAFLLLATSIGVFLGSTIVQSVRGLSVATRRLADGDPLARVASGGADELGQLGASFNAMADRLEVQTVSLRNAHEDLEQRVRERTADLMKTTEALKAEILERQRAEETTRSNQRLLQAIIDNSFAVIYVKDLQGRYLLVNRRYCEIFHMDSAADALGKTDHEIFPPAVADAFRAMDLRVAATEHPLVEEEVAPHQDGPHTYLSVKCRLRDSQGQVNGVFGISTDITERKLAEDRQRAQLERLNLLDQITRSIGERQDLHSIYQVVARSLEDHLPLDFACVCGFDAVANVLTVIGIGSGSQDVAMELAMVEHSRIEIDQNGLSQCVRGRLVYEPDLDTLAFPFPQRLVRGGLHAMVIAPLLAESKVFGVLVAARRDRQSFSSGECEFLRQLSEHVALAAQQAQLYSALQQAYDDLKQTQETVMQQERLRTLGQMASGIAHDINNAISPVALYTESLLEREPGLSERTRDYLEHIQRATADVAATVARMREFYREREPQLELMPVQLNTLARQVMDLTRARWSDMAQGRGVMIEPNVELAPGLPSIMGVESEIREALINLVFNAIDAMPDGGRLSLRTRVQPVAALDGAGMQQVCIDVEDSGVGMSEETRKRCLEPFYTTKGERGTGLGLAMVYGTVQRHSADIDIRSAPGQGTTVALCFAAVSAVEGARIEGDAGSDVAPVPLHLLIVDDDPFLLRAVHVALEREGHRVVAKNAGQAGIDTFATSLAGGEAFDAVITDLGMPYVDGRMVAAAIKRMSPSTPVIMLTGWGERLIAECDIPEHVDQMLSKPPKLRDLRLTLARLCRQGAS
ncbi:MAG: PAS domain-containing protein [Pseudomonadota bacterium]